MATNATVEGSARRARPEPGDGAAQAAPLEAGPQERAHGLGAVASTMREVVFGTVQATFDALRGRYDR